MTKTKYIILLILICGLCGLWYKKHNKFLFKFEQITRNIRYKISEHTPYEGKNLFDEAYVINIDSAQERWKSVSNELNEAGVKYKRISATTGYNILLTDAVGTLITGQDIQKKAIKLKELYQVNCNSGKEKIIYEVENRNLGFVPGELGLICSNMRIWQDALANNYKNIVVFEDDIKIKRPKLFLKELNQFIEELPKTYDVAFYGTVYKRGESTKIKGTKCVYRPGEDYNGYGAEIMIFSEKGMKKLLKNNKYNYHIDLFYFIHNIGREKLENGDYLETYHSCYTDEFRIEPFKSTIKRY